MIGICSNWRRHVLVACLRSARVCDFLVQAAVPAGARIGESFDRHLGQASASSSRPRLPFTPGDRRQLISRGDMKYVPTGYGAASGRFTGSIEPIVPICVATRSKKGLLDPMLAAGNF
jgi:hypothetical protein